MRKYFLLIFSVVLFVFGYIKFVPRILFSFSSSDSALRLLCTIEWDVFLGAYLAVVTIFGGVILFVGGVYSLWHRLGDQMSDSEIRLALFVVFPFSFIIACLISLTFEQFTVVVTTFTFALVFAPVFRRFFGSFSDFLKLVLDLGKPSVDRSVALGENKSQEEGKNDND